MARPDARRVDRNLHPVAWWVWAIGLATAVSRTTNPLLLLLALASVGYVVARRRTEAPWARGLKYYLAVALVVIAIRVVFRAVFGGDVSPDDHILFRLPQVPLPGWADGIQLGGPVGSEAVLSAAFDGLRLGCLLCCIGAANALANPKRALRILPGALYELGVAVVVAVSVAPQLVESIQRVRRARRLRPVPAARRRLVRRGRALGGILVPVLEDALERSLRLAAAMDSRGFGRTGPGSRRDRRITGGLMLGGMSGLCIGAYGLLDATSPRLLGLPALGAGAVLCAGGLALGGRRVKRSRYRPDPWRGAEWAVAACGVVPALILIAGWGVPAGQLNPALAPLAWPPLPLVAAAAIAGAGLAGIVSPAPARPRRPAASRSDPRATVPVSSRTTTVESPTVTVESPATAEVTA